MDTGRSRTFEPSFIVSLKFVEFFTSCVKPEKYLGHSGRSVDFVTPFEITLELLEWFTTCGKSEKMVGTLMKV